MTPTAKWTGTYSEQHSTLFLRLVQTSLFFISPHSFNVVSTIRVVGFVVGDIELAHRGGEWRWWSMTKRRANNDLVSLNATTTFTSATAAFCIYSLVHGLFLNIISVQNDVDATTVPQRHYPRDM
jgi:hypothetical protein